MEKTLCDNTFKTFQVWNKPKLGNIFKSHLGYDDLQGLRNSLIILRDYKKLYLQWLSNLVL